ncbi:MAG: division/cell wall cluster transcriptional repressor MraZ [Bacteroidota bacterium]|nr:division/cell wall cluster transcriptional repressor MraZ [Bacteroidota bacterium]
MASFKGTYKYSVDSKGRLNIPSKLRKQLTDDIKDHFVVMRGFDKCLFVYPINVWADVEAEFIKLSAYNSEHRQLERTIYANLSEVELDSQARISIPPDLREYAQIDSDALIIGIRNRIEIWNPKIYEEYISSQVDSYETVAQKVMNNLG